VIVNGARTAFGAFGGGLAGQTATDLAVAASKAAIERSKVDPERIGQVVMGNVLQTSKDAIYLARHVALRSGLKEDTPGLILNLLCGSGVKTVAVADMVMEAGQAEVVLCGGTDSLSMTPYMSWGVRWGNRMGAMEMFDGLDIRDTLPDASMGETAENLQAKYNISREEQDEFALTSQMRAKEAQESGRFAQEIVPVEVPAGKGKTKVIDRDEHPKPQTTLEGLAKLKPAFRKGGTRVVSWALTGVPPEIMGIGPVPAIPMALEKAGLKLEDIDLIEINEAFAAQYLACEKDLKLDRATVNVNGGAIALGHPFGATGSRLILSLSLELQKRKAKYGVVSLCIGGGMGIAMVLERI